MKGANGIGAPNAREEVVVRSEVVARVEESAVFRLPRDEEVTKLAGVTLQERDDVASDDIAALETMGEPLTPRQIDPDTELQLCRSSGKVQAHRLRATASAILASF